MDKFKEPIISEDAPDTDRKNESAEVHTKETATELNTELLQSINAKLDLLLAASEAKEE